MVPDQLYTIPAKVTFKRWAERSGTLTARFRLRNGGSTAVGPIALRAPSRSKRFGLTGAKSIQVLEPGDQIVYTASFVPPAADKQFGNYQDAAVFSINGEAVLHVMLQAIRDGDTAEDATFMPKASDVVPPSLLAPKMAAATALDQPAKPPAGHSVEAGEVGSTDSATDVLKPSRPRSARASRGVTEAKRLGGHVPAVILHPTLHDMFFIEGQWIDAKGQEWSEAELKSLQEDDKNGADVDSSGQQPGDVIGQHLQMIEAAEERKHQQREKPTPKTSAEDVSSGDQPKERRTSVQTPEISGKPPTSNSLHGRCIVARGGEEYFLPLADGEQQAQNRQSPPDWIVSSGLVSPVQTLTHGDATYEDEEDDFLRRIEGEMNQRSASSSLSSGMRRTVTTTAKPFSTVALAKSKVMGDSDEEDDARYFQQLVAESKDVGPRLGR
eukprot:SAG31_NODE_932_length_10913_cov_3.933235_5_plen_440_part_00